MDDSDWGCGRALFGCVSDGFELKNLKVHANKPILSCEDGIIVGFIEADEQEGRIYIDNCTSLGTIILLNDGYRVGGIVGNNGYNTERYKRPTIVTNCYNIGKIIGKTDYGAIAGKNEKTIGSIIENSYYLNTSSDIGYTNDDSTISREGMKTTEEMKIQSFVDLMNTGLTENVWKMDIGNKNNGYPILNWQ